MTFTDTDLKSLKTELAYCVDLYDSKLPALVARLEAAEACIPSYFGDVCECVEICDRHQKSRDEWLKVAGK
jgi:hypothetical protein